MKKSILSILFILLGFMFCWVGPSPAATFTVNTTADTVDVNPGDGTAADGDGHCSLRAAIMEANALYGPDIIELPEGTFKITLEGTREDLCSSGDLDILSHLTIQGAGRHLTVIDGNQLDRVFHISGNVNISMYDLTITNGHAPNGKEGTATEFDGGDGEAGGGIKNNDGILTLRNCEIVKNSAGSGGGGLFYPYEGDGGDGASGGGIYNANGELYLLNCNVSNNSAGDGGDGEFSGYGGDGGGIYTKGTLTADSGHGPDQYNGGDDTCTAEVYLLLENCLISANRSGHGGWLSLSGNGGGLYNYGSDIKILNCSFSGNYTGTATHTGKGGGIYNAKGQVSILHCTITLNWIGNWEAERYVGSGGGIYGDTHMKNSIVANNHGHTLAGPDCCGTIHSLGYNLIENPSGCTIEGVTEGNIIGKIPRLEYLADNGGPTMTHALVIGSPAIDAADPDSVTATDQRGMPRPIDGNGDGLALPDIGAYERSFPTVEIVSPQHNGTVRGTAAVRVDVDYAERVEFYIDGHLAYTAEAEPYDFDWDTTLFTNGKHRIKAAALDIAGQRAEDEIQVRVDNVIMHLNASRQEEKAWIIKKLYGKLDITLENTGAANVDRYVIERKEGDGSYHTIKEIPASEFQGNTHTYHDIGLNADTDYTYRVLAVDGGGQVVGRSKEKTI
jgi:CSLREA domain-containing protein